MVDKKKIWQYVIDVILIVLVVVFIVRYNQTKDNGAYHFCIEWNNNMYREDLLWKCWNIKEGIPLCNWEIYNNTLFVYDYYDKSNYVSYSCTEYAKTVEVKLSEEILDFEEV